MKISEINFRSMVSDTRLPYFVWETKLKILRKEVKIWARENEKQNKKRMAKLIKKMENLQGANENKEEDKEDHLQEKELFWEIYRENRKEEEQVRLKSRSLWLKAGDKNTTFFHNSMKMRKARNQIDKIQVDEQEIKGVEELKTFLTILNKSFFIVFQCCL